MIVRTKWLNNAEIQNKVESIMEIDVEHRLNNDGCKVINKEIIYMGETKIFNAFEHDVEPLKGMTIEEVIELNKGTLLENATEFLRGLKKHIVDFYKRE